VRERANERCEYCRKPEIFTSRSYHADHIIPERHGGTTSLHNLAWACFDCNVNKAGDISSYDKITGELVPFYNPRTQSWDEHFELESTMIKGKTAVGRVTVSLLNINHPDHVATRHYIIEKGYW